MVRVEKNSNNPPMVEVAAEPNVQVKKKKFNWKLSCLGLFFLSLVLVAALIVWLLAAAGLITVPVVSGLVYKSPQPSRTIASGIPVETLLTERFNSLITERLQEGGGNLQDRAVTVTLPESALTTSLKTVLQTNNLNWLKSELAQVAINEKQGLEIYLPLANSSNNNAIILTAVLSSENKQLSLSEITVKIGCVTLPTWFSQGALVPLLQSGLVALNQELGRYAAIEAVDYQNGQVLLSGTLIVEILELQ